MIDLNRKSTPKPEKTEPEDIVMVIIAVIIWAVIVIGWIRAC